MTSAGERDLETLLRNLCPVLQPEEHVFCTVPGGTLEKYGHLSPLAAFHEQEGLTLVLTRDVAQEAGLVAGSPMRRITLNVHSSLDAVGLTAAVSTALADGGISANVIAAYYHDHVFVPLDRAEQALAILDSLAD